MPKAEVEVYIDNDRLQAGVYRVYQYLVGIYARFTDDGFTLIFSIF